MAPKPKVKLLIDTSTNKVLFAEANKDFIDFLFTLLAFPIAHVTELLTEERMVGSIGSLHKSLKDLPLDYMQPNTDKNIYLKPKLPIRISSQGMPLLGSPETTPDVNGTTCSQCKTHMGTPAPNLADPIFGSTSASPFSFLSSSSTSASPFSFPSSSSTSASPFSFPSSSTTTQAPTRSSSSSGEGCVKGVVTYMVMDNLEVSPMSAISSMALLNKFHVKDVGGLVEKVVEVGINEGLALLKASLESKTVLTDVFGEKPKTFRI